jgi:hypothetical protein
MDSEIRVVPTPPGPLHCCGELMDSVGKGKAVGLRG